MANVIAFYIRLSNADDDTGIEKLESNSISNQRLLLSRYVETHPEFDSWEIREFVDDGYTGTNENRPAFQQMISEASALRLQAVIVKDFSRFARNYILMGEFLEQYFPLLGVRFISVNDSYDSKTTKTSMDSMSAALKAVLNAYYSKEMSNKLHQTARLKMKDKIVTGFPPFGYVFNEDKTQFIVDPEAADAVRQVFHFALSNASLTDIANALTEAGIPTPSAYNRAHNSSKKIRLSKEDRDEAWITASVLYILRNPVYTGRLTLQKRMHITPASKHTRPATSSEQFVYENAHEAIISAEDFAKVQELHPPRTRSSTHVAYDCILRGHVFCKNCGRAMRYDGNKKTPKFYCAYKKTSQGKCPQKRFNASEVENMVLAALIPMLKLLNQFMESDRGRQSHYRQWLSDCRKELGRLQKEFHQAQNAKLALYEQFSDCRLTPEAYKEQKAALARKADQLQKEAAVLQEREKALREGIAPAELENLSEAAARCQNPSVLTVEMVAAFVDRVEFSDDCIEIKWTFQDVWEYLQKAMDISFAENSREEDSKNDGEST